MYRIVQWGTGNVGKQALLTILERPDYELAGVRVYNPDKVGTDAGQLVGLPDTGVRCTDSTDEILALDADCVCYTALGSTIRDAETPTNDICTLLASGKNVVSSALEFHAYLKPEFQLPGAGQNALERFQKACAEGNSTFYHIGVNPGYSMDQLPIFLSRLSRRIDKITATEIVNMTGYPSEHMIRESLGFGKVPGDNIEFDEIKPEESAFAITARMVADALGIEWTEQKNGREVALTERDIEIAVGTIEAGTVAAQKRWFQGIVNGKVVLQLEFVWRVSDDCAPDWPTGASRWLVHIDGDPVLDSEVSLSTTSLNGRATSLAVATLLLNAVPTVVAAEPGMLNNLNIPFYGGGYVSA